MVQVYVNLILKNPIKLNNLHILFKTINNENYDFDNMMYNLSFQLIISKV